MLVEILLRRVSPGLCAQHRSCFSTRVAAQRVQTKSWNSGNHVLRTPNRRNTWSFLQWKWKSKDEKDDGRQDQALTDGAISRTPKEFPEAHMSNGLFPRATISPKTTQVLKESERIPAIVNDEHLANTKNIRLPSRQTNIKATTNISTAAISNPRLFVEPEKYPGCAKRISSPNSVSMQLVKPVSLHEISMSIRTDSIGFLDPRSVIAGYHQYRFKDSMAHAKRPSITSDWDKIPKHKWIFEVVMIYLAFEPLVGRSILKGFPLRRFAEHSSMTQAILLNGASLRHFIYPICIDLFRRGKHAPDGLGAVTQLLQEHGHWNIPNPSHGSADKITVSSQAKGNLSQSDFPVNGLQSSLIETMPELSSDIGGSTSTATSTALLCITSFPDAIHTLRFGNPSELHIDSVKAGFLQSYHGLASGEGASYIRSFHLLLLYLLARPVAGTLSPTSVDEASEVLALYFSYFSKKNLLFSGPRHGALRSFAKNLRDLLVHGKLDDQLTASYILGEVKGQYAKFEYQYDNVTVQLPGTTKVLKVTTFLEALESLRSGFAEDLDPASVFSGCKCTLFGF